MFTVSARLSGENNKDYSYRVIKDAIMYLELQPGQTISEIELAEALQISRTPIREVMAKLREEYLVEVFPQVGTYVSKIKSQLIEEAAFMRVTLEKEVLKESCESFPKEKLFELKRNIFLQEELLGQKGTERTFHKLDTDFHHIIFQGNNRENVWGAIIRLSTHYNRIRLLSEMKEHNLSDKIAQHKNIVKIIENKEVDQVEESVREHIIEPIKHWGDLYDPNSVYAHYLDLTHKMPVFQ
ncbi:GntR family transcriptional regulator [Bacillus sp. V3B]|uniref:GntR family transcriptional regulator n=1 Tax=Bacillus sp. V3B TaxID=2804915 RepID=UPI002109AE25|nr:GntR family transcriptional regulator [Bacillus sp. V3B]MCQ6275660.1 GntR family transcriptional regulator [Bacillus sp. V3B]